MTGGARLAVTTMLVVFVIALVAAAIALLTDDETGVLDLGPGDCFDLPDVVGDEVSAVTRRPCDEPHEAEVVAIGELNPDRAIPYGDPPELFAEAERRCIESVGGDAALVESFGLLPVVADVAGWDATRGRFVCVAIPYGGGTTRVSATPNAASPGGQPLLASLPARAISSVG